MVTDDDIVAFEQTAAIGAPAPEPPRVRSTLRSVAAAFIGICTGVVILVLTWFLDTGPYSWNPHRDDENRPGLSMCAFYALLVSLAVFGMIYNGYQKHAGSMYVATAVFSLCGWIPELFVFFFGIKMSSPFSYINLENDIVEGVMCTQPSNSSDDLKEALECKRMLSSLQTFRSNMDPSVDYGSAVATLNWLILSAFFGVVATLVSSVGADRYSEQRLKEFVFDQTTSFGMTFALILGAQMEYSQYAIDAGQEGVNETGKLMGEAFCDNQHIFAKANPNFATTTGACWTSPTPIA